MLLCPPRPPRPTLFTASLSPTPTPTPTHSRKRSVQTQTTHRRSICARRHERSNTGTWTWRRRWRCCCSRACCSRACCCRRSRTRRKTSKHSLRTRECYRRDVWTTPCISFFGFLSFLTNARRRRRWRCTHYSFTTFNIGCTCIDSISLTSKDMAYGTRNTSTSSSFCVESSSPDDD